jgi:hypothetical protein
MMNGRDGLWTNWERGLLPVPVRKRVGKTTKLKLKSGMNKLQV